ncbi:MAG: HigA family addiction module antitoxin [Desulfovibrionaceae bacterium]|nr:HigA family addiction module antitoxin [Desulfovibrionaceae bacterium]
MHMHSPPHPGEIIRDQCLEPLRLTVSEAARGLGVTRKTFSELVNGRSGVSPEMALRLSKAFGGTPETWLTLQLHYDLAKARNKAQDMVVRRFSGQATA